MSEWNKNKDLWVTTRTTFWCTSACVTSLCLTERSLDLDCSLSFLLKRLCRCKDHRITVWCYFPRWWASWVDFWIGLLMTLLVDEHLPIWIVGILWIFFFRSWTFRRSTTSFRRTMCSKYRCLWLQILGNYELNVPNENVNKNKVYCDEIFFN